ncbi:MAG: hypothetical protein QXS14_05650 [Desulfurococcaceae archaeon]
MLERIDRGILESMRALVHERKELVVRIGKHYEIGRPLALELWRMFVGYVFSKGGFVEENLKVEYASDNRIVVSMTVRIKVGEAGWQIVEVGEATAEEGKEDTMARIAFTRAMKRVLERAVGEDFINKVIKEIYPEEDRKLITEKQKQVLLGLYKEGKLKDIDIENIDKLSREEASELITKATGR